VRLLEGRLVGFAYAGQGTALPAMGRRVRRLARAIETRGARSTRSTDLAGQVLVHVLSGPADRLRLSQAAEMLERALRQQPRSAGQHVDLAAIYLAIASPEEPWFVLRALEAAHRAVELDPALPAARFNLALAFEKTGLNLDARLAWGSFLRLEPDSGWANEANAHLAALARPSAVDDWGSLRPALERASQGGESAKVAAAVAAHPLRALQFAAEEALPQFVEVFALVGRGEEAERQSVVVRALGASLARHGEPFVLDSLEAVERLTRPGDRRDALAAYHDYAEATALCLANQGWRGQKLLASASRTFRRLGLPMRHRAAYASALCAYQRTEYRQAIRELQALVDSRQAGRYPSVLGRSQWLLGLAHQSLGEPEAALAAYEAASRAFGRFGAEAAVQHLVAESLVFLGDPWAAWKWLFQGVHGAVDDGEVRRRYSLMDKAGEAAEHTGFLIAAFDFRHEVTRLAGMEPDASGLTHAYLKRAEAHAALGRAGEAAADLTRAEHESRAIPDPSERRRRAVDLLVARSKLQESRSPEAALRYLAEALSLCLSTSFRMPLVDIQLARGKALRRMGRAEEAEAALLAGAEEFEHGRRSLSDAASRMSYFARARETFEELIDLRARRAGGAEAAFDIAEQMRARVLLDGAAQATAGPPPSPWTGAASAGRLRQALPDGVAVLSYASLPQRLVMWVARRDRPLLIAAAEIGAIQLEHDVDACRRAMLSEDPGAAACLTRLHTMLVAPVRAALDGASILVVVPDAALHGLPFAALLAGGTRRHLLEDFNVVVYPSAAILLRSVSHSPSQSARGIRSVVALVDPAFDRQRFPELASLPGGRREGSLLRALFGGRATVLDGSEATLQALRQGLLHADAVHIGAHSLVAGGGRTRWGLVLAGTGAVLAPDAIGRLHVGSARLVVLGGCGTGLGRRVGSEGVLSVARAFQAAGATSVVATLWSIEDEAASHLYEEFYRALGQGSGPSEALRSAQRAVLDRARASGTSAYRTWAAPVALGTWWERPTPTRSRPAERPLSVRVRNERERYLDEHAQPLLHRALRLRPQHLGQADAGGHGRCDPRQRSALRRALSRPGRGC
jgi:CHAT domain-containing protein/tetratricopeptide (TPR) repeat protein